MLPPSQELGRGGFGAVVLANLPGHPTPVVAKLVPLEDPRGEGGQFRRFCAEALVGHMFAQQRQGARGGCLGVGVVPRLLSYDLVALYERAAMDGRDFFLVLRRSKFFQEVVVSCGADCDHELQSKGQCACHT